MQTANKPISGDPGVEGACAENRGAKRDGQSGIKRGNLVEGVGGVWSGVDRGNLWLLGDDGLGGTR